MQCVGAGWRATLLGVALATCVGAARAEDPPPTEPIPRIETGMHTGTIWRVGMDSTCRLMVTGSEDKTARLWAIPEGGIGEPKLLRVLRVPIGSGYAGSVNAVALSPNGRFVAAGGWGSSRDNRVYIFEAATGKLLRRLDRVANVTTHLTFSLDGKYLAATFGGGEGVRVWETAKWSLVGEDNAYDGKGSYGAAFDKADRLYTVSADGLLRRYGSGFKLEAKSKTLGGADSQSVAVHPDGDRVAVSFFDSSAVEIYGANDLRRLAVADTAGVNNSRLSSITWSADGKRLYAAGGYQVNGTRHVRIWDRNGRNGRDVPVAGSTIQHLLSCRDAVAVAASDPAFGLISLTGEKRLWLEAAIPDMRSKLGQNFTVSDDGSKVRFGLGYGGATPVLFDLAAGRLTDQPEPVDGLTAPDTESLKLGDWEGQYVPKLNGKALALEAYETSRSAAVAPGGDRFVLGTEWYLRAFDKNGKEVWQSGPPSVAWGVNIPRNGKLVVAAYGDGTIRWHRLSDGAEILALFVNTKSREWVLWTPQGYYASSAAGDQYIGWHLNKGWDEAGEFVTAARLKQHLYRPDVVKRAFELANPEQAVREAGLRSFKLDDLSGHAPPEFHIIDPRPQSHANKSPVAIRLDIAASDDPVTSLDAKVNARQVTPQGNVGALPKKTGVQRTLNIPLERGENRIQIVARNAVGETVQELLLYLDGEGALNRKGNLFVLAIGVNNDVNPEPQTALRYAGADARLIVETLTRKAGHLYSEVLTRLLVSGGATPPTKANIEDALALFADAQPEDTVILFLAGHGVNEGADYLFVPEDVQRMPDGHWRPSTMVRWPVLQRAVQNAQGRRIMFVDTVHSSGAYSPRLIKDASDSNIIVFAATDGDTLAQERSELGHGVFTYALNEGLDGAADVFKKGGVNIFELGAYVSDKVRQLTNAEQEPTVTLSGSKNFMLAYGDPKPHGDPKPAVAKREDVLREFAAAKTAGTCEALDAVVSKYARGVQIAEEEVQEGRILSERCKRDRSIRALMNKGKAYALIIGEQNYKDRTYKSLDTPRADAEAVEAILTQQYGFTTELKLTTKGGSSTKSLSLHDASKREILDLLTDLSLTLTENDRLVIYYAGHGQQDKRTGGTYWIPVDADADRDLFDWISAHEIIEHLKIMRARSILVVSDSCFSGALFRDARGEPTDAEIEASLAKDAEKRSRVLISSGGIEPVLDGGGSGHSIFARKFLDVLKYSKENVFSAVALHKKIKAMVSGNVEQVPRYDLLDERGNSGDFVFVTNESAGTAAR